MKQAIGRTKQVNPIWIHLGVWAIYWCLDIIKFSWMFTLTSKLLTEILINLLSGTLFFYVLLLFVLPPRTGPIKVFPIVWKLLLALFVCIAFRHGMIWTMSEWTGFTSSLVTNIKFFFVTSFNIYTQFGIYAVLVWFFQKRAALQKQVFQKELNEKKLQHAALKAQINPHFLFNTLGFIHSKALASGEDTIEKMVISLSEVLHYALDERSSNTRVSLQDEMRHIQKLHEINELRFSGKCYFHILQEGITSETTIPPLILVIFFENAMKYGVFDDPQHPVVLQLKQSGNQLEISMKNKIRQHSSPEGHTKFAIGKRYIRTILEEYCKNNYILQYRDDGIFHEAYLKLTQDDELYYN